MLTRDEIDHVREALTAFMPTSDFYTEVSATVLKKLEDPMRPTGMNFREFKMSQPAISMFRKLGLLPYLAGAESWRSLRELIVHYNDCDKGLFVDAVRQCDGVCSSGERILLHAICYVTDFAWLADELGGDKVWRNMDRASGEFKRCIAACVGAEVY